MVRRMLGLVLFLSTSVLTLTGCQGLRHAVRSDQDGVARALKKNTEEKTTTEVAGVESDPSKISAVDSDSKGTQSFFKKNRRPGTWSSEAREIESHLGVQ